MRYEIVTPTWEQAQELARTMRKADINEIWAAAHQTPEEALATSLSASPDPKAGLVDGRVVCIFGIAQCSVLSLTGVPWLLGAEELPKHSKAFLRRNKAYIVEVKEKYPRLENYVDARNKDALKWLTWLGFTLEPAAPFGVEKLPFHRFHWENNVFD